MPRHEPPRESRRGLERSVYGAPAGSRPKAFVFTLLLHGAVVVLIAIKWSGTYPVAQPSAPLAVSLLPLASPPETPPTPKEAPRPVEKQELHPTPPRAKPIELAISPLLAISPPASPQPSPAVKPADHVVPQPDAAAPKTVPAPSASLASSNAPDTWEGCVLARLEKFRRYPDAARSTRQQGVAYIRFRINRDGHVLTSSLVRSSGFPALDKAAFETLRRADPLPRVPADRPDEIELLVPVEFYTR